MLVNDDDLVGDTDYTWTPDNEYVLDGFVFLEEGSTLTIEPGTVVRFTEAPTNGVDNASALIITRGAQIFAEGTVDEPIIFTAEDDDLDDPNDFSLEDDRGSWGGLIVLGNATVGVDNNVGETGIEGIPGTEARALYGGAGSPNDTESSGILRYVSIRYGGAELSPGDEINGLTLGGVGSGTIVDYVEIFGNTDDGLEIFGGTVDVKHIFSAFCGDESFDTDQGWSGRGQFIFGIQLSQDPQGNQQYGTENDGSENPSLDPVTVNRIFNATFIGPGPDINDSNGQPALGARIRLNAAMEFTNSIFTEFPDEGLRIQNTSVDRYLDDEFQLPSNLWYGFGVGNDPTDFIIADERIDEVIAKILAEGNTVAPVELGGISRVAGAMSLDPRPNASSPALTGWVNPDDDWFDNAEYRGAFSNADNWALGWTATDALGYFGDLVNISNTVDLGNNAAGVALNVPTPNPAVNTAFISYELPRTMNARLIVFDLQGRLLDSFDFGRANEGVNQFEFSVANYAAGTYNMALITETGVVSQRFTVMGGNR